jgi:lysophospholipase L1-like esterase
MGVGIQLREHFGLTKPYKFERTLALCFGGLMILAVAVVALAMSARSGFEWGAARGISWDTPRGWYFIYVAGLLAAGLAFARWPAVAAVLLSLAAIEIGLGFGSAALYQMKIARTPLLFPNNYVNPRYEWHPLLQVRPSPTVAGSGTNFINSLRMRGPERTAADLKDKAVVALFGGSTTLDFASPDGESWPDRLGQILGDKYAVINHGVAGYTTAEHVIQTAFFQEAYGVRPTCAVYYVGWNDMSLVHLDGLDTGYTDHMRNQLDAFMGRRLSEPYIAASPLLDFLSLMAAQWFDTVRSAQVSGTVSAEPDPKLEAIFLHNVESISAMNRQRKIRTIWVGQVMNIEGLKSDSLSNWTLFVRHKDIWALIERLNGLLKRQAEQLRDAYIDVPAQSFPQQEFADGEGHFSPAGSNRFAKAVAPAIEQNCRPSRAAAGLD